MVTTPVPTLKSATGSNIVAASFDLPVLQRGDHYSTDNNSPHYIIKVHHKYYNMYNKTMSGKPW